MGIISLVVGVKARAPAYSDLQLVGWWTVECADHPRVCRQGRGDVCRGGTRSRPDGRLRECHEKPTIKERMTESKANHLQHSDLDLYGSPLGPYIGSVVSEHAIVGIEGPSVID